MKNTLTLSADAWTREGSADFGSGEVAGYKVNGMPDGAKARIANFGAPNRNDWQIMRINVDDTQDDWTGTYQSAEEALAVLQSEGQTRRRYGWPDN
jgi:hypothetical protein